MAPDTLPPTIVPRYGGGLQFEWHVHGVDLEIAIGDSGEISIWCEHTSGREWEDDGEIDIARVRKELSLLTAQ